MAEAQQIEQVPHRHRRRRRRSKVKRRLLWAGMVIVLFVAWGLAVMKVTQYLAKKDDLGKQYHELDPGAFDKNAKSNRRY